MNDFFKGKANPLDEKGLDDALSILRAEQPELWAVLSVETAGSGYLPDRRPRILFERHCSDEQQMPNMTFSFLI